ncbi:LPS-assembly protein LptD [Maritalea sp.]|uniref:LPS-assembly protein LptD n=1 Tax=Maritalea sp. TaxID=2003361 RepID=UPI003EF8C81D
MSIARNHAGWSSIKRALRNTLCVLCFFGVSTQIAVAKDEILPADFFATQQLSATSSMLVSADFLDVDNNTSIVTATGNVRMSTEGYLVAAERAEYNQDTGKVILTGSVAVRDPDGQQYIAERAELFGGFKQGFLKSLVFETPEGLRLNAADAEFQSTTKMILGDASLTPCGNCIDSKGRQIGWRIKAAKVVRDTEEKTIYFTSGTLEIAGIPVAYLPWLALPDPSLTDFEDILRTSVSYSPKKGVAIKYPGFVWHNPSLGLTISPEFYSRQGILGEVNWRKTFGNVNYAADAWGIYQLDPTAYAGGLGDRGFRGGFQVRANTTFADGWTVGGQYTAFTDRSFLPDYDKGNREGSFAVQTVYTTKLSADSFVDARVEYRQGLSDGGAAVEARQGQILPQIIGHNVTDLPDGNGQILLDGKLINIVRTDDSSSTIGGVEYVDGFSGSKTHLMMQAAWRNEWTLPGGILIAPYLGLRGDVAQYSDASTHASAPSASLSHSATPIAALDVSWPFVADAEGATHYFTPRLQVVSRGGPTSPGITNEDAQSFVFDDSNLFSFNRFSGIDRQESGTRASLGFTYHADLDDGRWFDVTIGQSYQIGGTNGATTANPNQTGIGSGVNDGASHIVLAAKGAPWTGFEVGTKLLIDPIDASIDRAAVAAKYAQELFSVGMDYAYQSADMAPGASASRQEVGGNVSVSITDYWTISADARYNLSTNKMGSYGVSVGYDDQYTAGSVYYRPKGVDGFKGDLVGFKLKLKMLADVGYDHTLQ